MPRFLIKTRPNADLYMLWSTVVDAPVWVGTRAEGLKDYFVNGNAHPSPCCPTCGQEWEGMAAKKLRLADLHGTSCVSEDGTPHDGNWVDDGLVYMGEPVQGWIPRESLHGFAEAWRDRDEDRIRGIVIERYWEK